MTIPHRRLLLVQPHPDDETIASGTALTRYSAEGAQVTLVTCTLGERGEVLVPELEHLRYDRDNDLAPTRLAELTAAMAALGVTDFIRLGGDGKYSDTGMIWADGRIVAPPDAPAASFAHADLLAPSDDLVAVLRDRRPQVVICNDQFGNYGHPDHIQSNRVATYAIALAGVPSYRPDLGEPWVVSRVLWNALSASQVRTMIRQARAAGELPPEQDDIFAGFDPDSDAVPPMSTPDEQIAVRLDGYPWREQRLAALHAHRTQIPPDAHFFRFAQAPPGPAWAECYRFAGGVPVPAGADDVFAGLD